MKPRMFAASPAAIATPPKRIGLFGLFGNGNSGNDGSLEAMVAALRKAQPDIDLTCICAEPAVVRAAYGIAAVAIGSPPFANMASRRADRLLRGVPHKAANWLHAVRLARRFDALIVPGTGILDDFCEGPSGMPAALFGWCLAAWASRTPVAFVSVGAGPIDHPISRRLMTAAARMARYRSFRDPISRDFMIGLGLDAADDPVCPDLAFALPTPRAKPGAPQADAPLTVGVGVMAYSGWNAHPHAGGAIYRDYLAKMARFVDLLLGRGCRVRLLTGDAVDERAIADLNGLLAAPADVRRERLTASPTASLHELMRQIAEVDLVVATRFHNVVCALKMGRPTISVGYAAKNQALLAEFGLGEFHQHVERLDLDLLVAQFDRLSAERDRRQPRILERNLEFQERLRRQDAQLMARLFGHERKNAIPASANP